MKKLNPAIEHARLPLQSFEARISPEPNSGCWIWTGGKLVDRRGAYGTFTKRSAGTWMKRAHRASWEFYRGPIPEGMHVLHKCDVPLCVNPDHLFLGTQADNMRDKSLKGRQLYGENHPHYVHGRYVGDKQNPEYNHEQQG